MAGQWEYITLRAIRGDISSYSVDIRDPIYVFSVNGKYIGKSGTGPIGNQKQAAGVVLEEFLAEAGKEGWELCGMTPITGRGDSAGVITVLLILKRQTR